MESFEERIAHCTAIEAPTDRNHMITAAYVALGQAMTAAVGTRDANWLHFGSWASASAGSVIRGESPAPARVRDTVLAGNTAIISDIGPRFARFLDLVDGEAHGQELVDRVVSDPLLTESAELADAFTCYAVLATGSEPATGATLDPRRHSQLMLRANVQIAHHEQRYADPLIDRAVPGGSLLGAITSQAITFRIPDGTLRVARDVPRPDYLGGRQWPRDLDTLDDPQLAALARGYGQAGDSTSASNAPDWQDLEERMGFIFCLFRAYQQDPAIQRDPLAG